MTNDFITTEQKLDNRLVVLLTDDTKHALKVKAAIERREMSDIVRDLIVGYLSKPTE